MPSRRVLLEAATFMDAPAAHELAPLDAADVREIVQRFLAACYDDAGKAPRLLDGDELAEVLRDLLPRRFGVRDPLADAVEPVLSAFVAFLHDTEIVSKRYEQRSVLDDGLAAFKDAVASGVAHRGGVAITEPGTTVAHRASKTGRNDPCPCGSGKKFKKCCMRLGG